jgi:hypothetical protein
MKKLTLALDELRVESFQVAPDPDRTRGTVMGAFKNNADSYIAYDSCGGGGGGGGGGGEYTYVESCPMQVTCRDSCTCTGDVLNTCGNCI